MFGRFTFSVNNLGNALPYLSVCIDGCKSKLVYGH